MRELSIRDMENLLIGAEILGCGGGGPVEWAQELIADVFKHGKRFYIVNPEEIPDDSLVVIVGRVGGGVPEEIERRVAGLKRVYENPEFIAVRELSKYLGEKPYAFLPSEIGAGNTVIPMYVAAMNDAVTIDGDACGRAKPEIALSTTNVCGLPTTPLCIVSPFEDIIILKDAVDDYRVEDICRQMAVVSGGLCGLCRLPVRGKSVRNAIVRNSISRAIKIGKEIRDALESKQNPVKAFIEVSEGYELFKGIVEEWTREKKGAFMWGNVLIKGINEYKGQEMRIWYKNEFLISWKNGKPYVTCPDTLCIVDASTSRGLSNWINNINENVGRTVVIVGIGADKIWRTEKGVKIFGPRHFNFDIDYTTVKKLVWNRSM